MIAAVALVTPHSILTRPLWTAARFVKARRPTPHVHVSIASVRPLRPDAPYERLIQEAAATHRLNPDLIRAVMHAESAFDPHAVSAVGAQGLMQLMPGLASDMGVTDAFDPRQNVMAGARYLRQLLDAHRGDITLALASYNAGPANVRRYKGVPPFDETRQYVRKIIRLLKNADLADD